MSWKRFSAVLEARWGGAGGVPAEVYKGETEITEGHTGSRRGS